MDEYAHSSRTLHLEHIRENGGSIAADVPDGSSGSLDPVAPSCPECNNYPSGKDYATTREGVGKEKTEVGEARGNLPMMDTEEEW